MFYNGTNAGSGLQISQGIIAGNAVHYDLGGGSTSGLGGVPCAMPALCCRDPVSACDVILLVPSFIMVTWQGRPTRHTHMSYMYSGSSFVDEQTR